MASKVLIILSKISPKVTEVVDVTSVFQIGETQSHVQDVGGWDSVVVQVVSPTSAINFNTTGDNGYVLGQMLPVPQVPVNWLPVQGTNILTNESVSTISASGAVRFQNIGKFLRISYGAAQVSPAALLPVDTLGVPGVARQLNAGSASANTALTTTTRRVSLFARNADIRYSVGSTSQTASATSHFIGQNERIDIDVPATPNIAIIRAGSTDGILELTELL